MQYSLYRYYGNSKILKDQYIATKNWTMFLESVAAKTRDRIDIGLGDWDPITVTPTSITSNLFYYQNLQVTSVIAQILGQKNDALRFGNHSKKVQDNFNTVFLKNGLYSIGTQCAQAFPLSLGIVPDSAQMAVITGFLNAIKKAEFHLTTGCFGIKYLFDALTEYGLVDIAYEIANQRDYPGYGYMISRGATTLWEIWKYNNNTYSHNHPMYGAIDEWFYKTVAGINQSPTSVAYEDILIRPQPGLPVSSASGEYNSIRGVISSKWWISNNEYCVNVTIPVNTKATVSLVSAYGCKNAPQTYQIGSGQKSFCVPCLMKS
jgi:alpha-L-rhamnosidase